MSNGNILREQSQIAEASMADLVITYNALTIAGKPDAKGIKKFESREIAMRRVEMAMLSAKNADAQTGVPQHTDGEVKTRDEIVTKARTKKVALPDGYDPEGANKELAGESLPINSMAADLQKQALKADVVAPREKKAPGTPSVPRGSMLLAIVATFAGTSKPQVGSVRNNVLLYIQAAPGNAISMEELDSTFMQNCRGYVQKLLEKAHLRTITLEELAQLREKAKDAPAAKGGAKAKKK